MKHEPPPTGPMFLTMPPKEKARQYADLIARREASAARYASLTRQRRMREAAAVQGELRVLTLKIMRWH